MARQYGYRDQVRAQRLLLENIGIRRLKLVLGASMGGMQNWLRGERLSNNMDLPRGDRHYACCDQRKEHDMARDGQPSHPWRPSNKTLLRFTEAEGAGAHCQMGAGRLGFARMFDWLDETLAPS